MQILVCIILSVLLCLNTVAQEDWEHLDTVLTTLKRAGNTHAIVFQEGCYGMIYIEADPKSDTCVSFNDFYILSLKDLKWTIQKVDGCFYYEPLELPDFDATFSDYKDLALIPIIDTLKAEVIQTDSTYLRGSKVTRSIINHHCYYRLHFFEDDIVFRKKVPTHWVSASVNPKQYKRNLRNELWILAERINRIIEERHFKKIE